MLLVGGGGKEKVGIDGEQVVLVVVVVVVSRRKRRKEKWGIDGELVGAGETRKTLSQQINEANTKLADFLGHGDEEDGRDDNLMV